LDANTIISKGSEYEENGEQASSSEKTGGPTCRNWTGGVVLWVRRGGGQRETKTHKQGEGSRITCEPEKPPYQENISRLTDDVSLGERSGDQGEAKIFLECRT